MVGKHPEFIALGSRLRGVPEVTTLGVKPNFSDYSPLERSKLLKAEGILYPTRDYAQIFTTMGKRIFPSLETYLYADEKIKQTTLFYLLDIPHPRTRFYYHLHHKDIVTDFAFPFVAKIPRSSAQGRGVFKINSDAELTAYLRLTNIAYIQEYVPHKRDLRVVLINYEPVLAYWRERSPQDFRTNLSQGGKIRFESVPEDGVKVAQESAWRCKLNDVGIDLIRSGDRWLVIEANMKYGRKGLKMKGLSLKEILRQKLLVGELL
jgi:ribosomal protein S6--L-glutamate ligase